MQAQFVKMEAQLRELGLKLNEIEAATEMTAPYLAYRKAIADLKVLHRRAENKLADLRMAGGGQTGKLEQEVEQGWAELDAAFRQLHASSAERKGAAAAEVPERKKR